MIFLQTTNALPVMPKKNINAYKTIKTVKTGRRVSRGIFVDVVELLLIIDEIRVVLIRYS